MHFCKSLPVIFESEKHNSTHLYLIANALATALGRISCIVYHANYLPVTRNAICPVKCNGVYVQTYHGVNADYDFKSFITVEQGLS